MSEEGRVTMIVTEVPASVVAAIARRRRRRRGSFPALPATWDRELVIDAPRAGDLVVGKPGSEAA